MGGTIPPSNRTGAFMRFYLFNLLLALCVLSFAGDRACAGDASQAQSIIDKLVPDNGSADVRTVSDGMTVSFTDGNEGKLWTRREYRTPIEISAVVSTDVNNIRLYYGDRGLVIFDWEMNGHELRHHDPKTGHQSGVADQGFVPPNTLVTVRWSITDDKSEVFVNGQKRCEFSGDYSELSGKVGIGTNSGSTLHVKSFEVGSSPGDSPPVEPENQPVQQSVSHRFEQRAGPVTALAKTQSEIKALYVMEEDTGGMLGLGSELIITATPGSSSGDTVPVSFTTPVGPEMNLVLDDVLRAINLKYPNIQASKFEFSFEDKYSSKDGGSIGAALGALMLSTIQGYDVDPQVAITGDVTADGKVRKIGGVGAKLRGAANAGCTLVALPEENYEQALDAMIYNGLGIVTDVQVRGVSNLDEAAQTVRSDRPKNLALAISLFNEMRDEIKNSPGYLQTPGAQAKLRRIIALAPQDISARLLLGAAQNTQRRRLSATASEYYTFVAVAGAVPTLLDPSNARVGQSTPEAINLALRDLGKVRPIADLRVQPLIDAWSEFIQACDDAEGGRGSADLVQTKRQALLDTMVELGANQGMIEKMLNESI